jgi:hypothetical protein
MVGVLVGQAPLERLAHDLADALGRQPLVARDLVIGPVLAQPGEMRARRATRASALSRCFGAGVVLISISASLFGP